MACLSVSTSYPYWVAFASLVRPCYLSLTHTVRNLAMIIKRRRFIFFHLFLVFFAAKYDRYSDSIFFIARGSHGAWPLQCNIIRSCTVHYFLIRREPVCKLFLCQFGQWISVLYNFDKFQIQYGRNGRSRSSISMTARFGPGNTLRIY